MKGYFFDPKQGIVNASLKQDGLKILPGTVTEADITGRGWLWSPPFVDLYAFLPDPGYEYREDRQSFDRAAHAGGYGIVMCRPETKPGLDNASVTKDFMGSGHTDTRILPLPAFSIGQKGKRMAELGELAGLGLWGVTHGESPVGSDLFLRHIMEYATNFGLTVVLTPYHGELSRGLVNEGPVGARLGISPDSWAGEVISINRYLTLAKLTGARLHITKVSTGPGVELIRRAKERGENVTASVAFYHLVLTDRAMGSFDPNLVVKPALRSETDRQALLQGLRDRTIDAVVSDHTPVAGYEKELELEFAVPGMIGMEFVFPVLMDLVSHGDLAIKDVLHALVTGPMAVSGLTSIGMLRLNFSQSDDAALVVIHSKAQNTPFKDKTFSAGVQWVAGR